MKSLRMYVVGALLVTSPLILVSSALAETYTYDAQGRITSATTDVGVVTYYCYDAAGNRTYVGPTAC
jgi:YD repeat-containing protein